MISGTKARTWCKKKTKPNQLSTTTIECAQANIIIDWRSCKNAAQITSLLLAIRTAHKSVDALVSTKEITQRAENYGGLEFYFSSLWHLLLTCRCFFGTLHCNILTLLSSGRSCSFWHRWWDYCLPCKKQTGTTTILNFRSLSAMYTLSSHSNYMSSCHIDKSNRKKTQSWCSLVHSSDTGITECLQCPHQAAISFFMSEAAHHWQNCVCILRAHVDQTSSCMVFCPFFSQGHIKMPSNLTQL